MIIFNRKVEQNLDVWKNNSNRKPLIIRGARQVGKTTLIKEFAKHYKYSIFLNLEKSTDASYFNNYDEAKILLESLFYLKTFP
jgi:predicted AAA+ superfamily ATPase